MTGNKIAANLLGLLVLVSFMLVGCGGITNTVQTCILSNEQYAEKDLLESAEQPESVEVGQAVYASVNFIESPLGMEYTARWYMDGSEVKNETKETTIDKSCIILFALEADKVIAGKLKFEIVYKDDVLFSKELSVE
jgi:uncharacterized protein YcfL